MAYPNINIIVSLKYADATSLAVATCSVGKRINGSKAVTLNGNASVIQKNANLKRKNVRIYLLQISNINSGLIFKINLIFIFSNLRSNYLIKKSDSGMIIRKSDYILRTHNKASVGCSWRFGKIRYRQEQYRNPQNWSYQQEYVPLYIGK